MSKKNTVTLPAEVAEKYELVGWTGSPKQFFGAKMGRVDVSALTLERADQLVSMGFRYLREKPAKPAKEKDTPKSEK